MVISHLYLLYYETENHLNLSILQDIIIKKMGGCELSDIMHKPVNGNPLKLSHWIGLRLKSM